MRTRFICVKCGIRLEGVITSTGKIVAYDRSGTDTTQPDKPCVCMDCQEHWSLLKRQT